MIFAYWSSRRDGPPRTGRPRVELERTQQATAVPDKPADQECGRPLPAPRPEVSITTEAMMPIGLIATPTAVGSVCPTASTGHRITRHDRSSRLFACRLGETSKKGARWFRESGFCRP